MKGQNERGTELQLTRCNLSRLEMAVLQNNLVGNEKVRRLQWPFDEYYVTSFGRVFSTKWNKVRELRATSKTQGNYLMVNLCVDGNPHPAYVHHIVVEAFYNIKPTRDWQTRHLDGNSHNNMLDNLAFGTAADNARDRMRHGTTTRGERSGTAKLTDRKVGWIRDLWAATNAGNSNINFTLGNLAEMFDVSRTTVSNIVNNKNWRIA